MQLEELDEFRGTERFVVERRLGAGGFGVVYRARDKKRDAVIALKTLSRGDSDALYRFKQEFRSLADIAHPNLVSLYELLSDGEQWFFTMELVDGVDFLDHVRGTRSADSDFPTEPTPSMTPTLSERSGLEDLMRPGLTLAPAADDGRLWPALSQLGEGLAALHSAGKLHRDIKPSNVLVTGAGRVVLLDFGLVSDLSKDGVLQSMHLVGTPAYMSPEQAAGKPVTAASDWYGVGVILYEALTGTRPFPGQFLDVLVQKQESEPPPPRELSPAISVELDWFCRSLLRKDPRDRPAEAEILACLRAAARRHVPSPLPARATPRPAPFVGRAPQLAALDRAFARSRETGAVVVLVEGLAGVGKTAILRRFLDDLSDREKDLVVLAGRCFEQETVPYKALDSLVDALSNYLKRLPTSEVEALLPRDLLPLARVFPVLRQVEAVAAARRRVLAIPDSQELRRRAFGALRELLARLSDRVPLVLFIDDLQWGDADSAALLAELLRPPDPPGLLLLACCRSEDAASSLLVAALRALPSSEGNLELEQWSIEALSHEEARALARAHLEDTGEEAEASIEAVARESQGNPLFIDELARHVRSRPPESGASEVLSGVVRLQDVIWERVAELPPHARRLLSTVAVAGRPLDRTVARIAAELSVDDLPALAVLRAGHLIRVAGSEEDHIEIYHELIRGTILERLTAPEREVMHERLALALETSPTQDAESLALHYEAAGAKERAAVYAADAAAKAAEALAFDRAARLYRQALELGTGDGERRQRLRVRLADALANAGRGAEAARVYLLAADSAGARDNLELQRKAAGHLLASGHVDEGLAVTGKVLHRIGMRLAATPRMAAMSLLLRRVQLRMRGLKFRQRTSTEVPADELVRIDTCWSVSTALSMSDTVRARDFQTRHLLLALSAGEPYRVARALGVEAAFAGLGGSRSRKRTEQLVSEALALAGRVTQPHAMALAYIGAGMSAHLEGRWGAGREFAQRCEQILREQCTGVTWEFDVVQVYSLRTLFFLGRLRELAEKLPRLLREAKERDDLYLATSLKTRHAYVVDLMNDEPDKARSHLRRAAQKWSNRSYYLQHYFRLIGDMESMLYAGSGAAAWQELAGPWRDLKHSLLLWSGQFLRMEALHMRARCAIGAALAAGSFEVRKLVRAALSDARRLERERTAWGEPLAKLVRAGAASLGSGDPSQAADLLAQAQTGFEAAEMSLYAAAVRRCRGLIVGGTEGTALVAAADHWMTDEGIRNPERMTAMLAPGRWTPTPGRSLR